MIGGRAEKSWAQEVAKKRMSVAAPPRKAKSNILALLYVNINQVRHLTTETIRKPTETDVTVLAQSIFNDNRVSTLSLI